MLKKMCVIAALAGAAFMGAALPASADSAGVSESGATTTVQSGGWSWWSGGWSWWSAETPAEIGIAIAEEIVSVDE